VKRSGRDLPMWVAIHMEAMLGFSLYSYLYLKLAKTPCFSYYLFLLFNKIGEEEDRTRSAWKGGDVAPIMYTDVSKCKNNKIN
jgi:hypothetical protein